MKRLFIVSLLACTSCLENTSNNIPSLVSTTTTLIRSNVTTTSTSSTSTTNITTTTTTLIAVTLKRSVLKDNGNTLNCESTSGIGNSYCIDTINMTLDQLDALSPTYTDVNCLVFNLGSTALIDCMTPCIQFVSGCCPDGLVTCNSGTEEFILVSPPNTTDHDHTCGVWSPVLN